MFGLEQESSKNPKKRFIFDLEKEISSDPEKGKKVLDRIEKSVTEIKQLLREGVNDNDSEFELLGALLQGYASLGKVLKKTMK